MGRVHSRFFHEPSRPVATRHGCTTMLAAGEEPYGEDGSVQQHARVAVKERNRRALSHTRYSPRSRA